jgi:hypothetical protein
MSWRLPAGAWSAAVPPPRGLPKDAASPPSARADAAFNPRPEHWKPWASSPCASDGFRKPFRAPGQVVDRPLAERLQTLPQPTCLVSRRALVEAWAKREANGPNSSVEGSRSSRSLAESGAEEAGNEPLISTRRAAPTERPGPRLALTLPLSPERPWAHPAFRGNARVQRSPSPLAGRGRRGWGFRAPRCMRGGRP